MGETMIKVKIDDQEHEVKPESLQLPEGYALIEPGKVPKGFFNQDALNEIVSERVKETKKSARREFEDDADFQKSILNKFNIELDKDGKPKGLKPDFDVDAWKQENAEKLTKPYKDQVDSLTQRASQLERGKIEADILRTANGMFKEEYTKSITGDDSPFVVDKFASLFGVDDKGIVALKEGDGFAVDGDGSRITPEKYFKANAEKLSPFLVDNRQKGSGFNQGGTATHGKKKNEYTTEQKAAFFEDMRKQGKKPIEEWNKLPN
jgi:hypothetical protein